VDALVEEGHEVSVVDNLWEHGGGREEHINPNASRYIGLDIRDARLKEPFERQRPEVVYHLAAQHSVAISTENPFFDANVNAIGTLRVLDCCAAYGVRKVVFASTSAVYGTVQQMPIWEDTPTRPESPYGCSKLAAEHYLHCWQQMHGLDYTILRYGNVYGPRQDPSGEAGVIAIFANHILRGEPVRIDWDGEQSKDYVYVGDVAQANVLALEQGSGEAYCIGTGYPVSVNALYERLTEIIGYKVEIERAPKRPGDVGLFAFDYSKAERELGWRPTVRIDEGLRRTVDYYRSLQGRDTP
jgi:UDP-glucose 4-epimerase